MKGLAIIRAPLDQSQFQGLFEQNPINTGNVVPGKKFVDFGLVPAMSEHHCWIACHDVNAVDNWLIEASVTFYANGKKICQLPIGGFNQNFSGSTPTGGWVARLVSQGVQPTIILSDGQSQRASPEIPAVFIRAAADRVTYEITKTYTANPLQRAWIGLGVLSFYPT